jgi:hypothetical protein
MSWPFKIAKHSFLRHASLSQTLDDNCWRRAWCLFRIPLDRELWIEPTRLGQSEFCRSVVPLRGLSSCQKGVGKIGPVPRLDCSLKLRKRRVKPAQTSLGKAEGQVPAAGEDRITGA